MSQMVQITYPSFYSLCRTSPVVEFGVMKWPVFAVRLMWLLETDGLLISHARQSKLIAFPVKSCTRVSGEGCTGHFDTS